MSTVGERIRDFRKQKKLSQAALGEMIGLTGVAVMRYEKGLRQPSLDTIDAIAKALGVDAANIVFSEPSDVVQAVTARPTPTPPAVDQTWLNFCNEIFVAAFPLAEPQRREVLDFAKFLLAQQYQKGQEGQP